MNLPQYAPLIGYESKKAAQIAAFFAMKQQKPIEKLKLIKLIYLCERDFIKQHGIPMLYDEFFSLKDGPICSSTLNGINGQLDKDIWDEFITRQDRYISPKAEFSRDQLDEISDAEMKMLESIWKSFGWMTASQIRNYAHKNCTEYVEVFGKGRIQITYKQMLQAQDDEEADEVQEKIDRSRRVKSFLR